MQGGDTQNCYATRPCDISSAGITNIYSAVSPRQQLRPFRWAFIPTCCTASPSRCFIFVLYLGRVGAIIHTYTTPHRLFICVVSPVLSVESQRLFGSKQWNHSPLSPSLIRRRIWGEWELTCKKSRADGDSSAAGDLSGCCSCLLLHRSRAVQLRGNIGAEGHAASTVNIGLHFSSERGLLSIKSLQTAGNV